MGNKRIWPSAMILPTQSFIAWFLAALEPDETRVKFFRAKACHWQSHWHSRKRTDFYLGSKNFLKLHLNLFFGRHMQACHQRTACRSSLCSSTLSDPGTKHTGRLSSKCLTELSHGPSLWVLDIGVALHKPSHTSEPPTHLQSLGGGQVYLCTCWLTPDSSINLQPRAVPQLRSLNGKSISLAD